MRCPDTREELKAIADKYKCDWVEGSWETEGEHCDAINQYTEGYDWLVRFDADEIYPEGSIKHYINQAEKTNCKNFTLPFVHFWRSFSRVCRDGSYPQRLTNLKGGEGLKILDDGKRKYTILHFGYAQPTKYIIYKMQVHGHKREWRPDWFKKRWLNNAQEDVHPVCYIPPMWNCEPFDKTKLPEVLKKHKFFRKDLIE